MVIHFFLPGTTAAMTYFVLARCDRLPDLDDRVFAVHRSAVVVVVVALGLAIASLWEMYEWTVLALYPSASIETSYDDTILDMAMGGSGSFVAGLLMIWWAKSGHTIRNRNNA